MANHPALLGWYLVDEPESGKTVAEVRAAYKQLKDADPAHPLQVKVFSSEPLSSGRGPVPE